MRQHVLFFILTFVSLLSFGQKKLIIIGNKWADSICSAKAIMMTNDAVKIDKCYADNKQKFAGIKSEPLSVDRYYPYLFNITMSEWETIQNTLDKIVNCDYGIPIKIEFTENNTRRTFFLKRFTNCYPESVRHIMESLESYFNNLK